MPETVQITKRGREWEWPAHDEKLIQVFDYVDDINEIAKYVDNWGICIQAGGACGVWPLRFSELFNQVVTFEPHPVNFHCLQANTAHIDNISAHDVALGDLYGSVAMQVDDFESNNCGAYYTKPGSEVPALTIDIFDLEPDLIQLDIEGSEYDALVGAEKTLRHKPVVVIEEKPLPHVKDHLKARKYLESLGYKEVGRVHRDVIFKC